MIEEFLQKQGFAFRKTNHNYMISCPFHEDRNPSFGIREDGVWHCFSCNRSGNFHDLKRIFGIQSQENFYEILEYKLSMSNIHPISSNNVSSYLPDFEPFDEDIPSVVTERISRENVKRFRIGVAKKSFPGYFVIPVETFSGFFGYACRHFLKDAEKRWLFSKGFRKTIFPAIPAREVIIVEGVIPAFRAIDYGFSASAVFGHEISDFQLSELIRLKPQKIVLGFDSYEAHFMDSIRKASIKLIPFFQVSLAIFPRDIDELQYEEFLYCISRAIRIDRLNFAIELKKKLGN